MLAGLLWEKSDLQLFANHGKEISCGCQRWLWVVSVQGGFAGRSAEKSKKRELQTSRVVWKMGKKGVAG